MIGITKFATRQFSAEFKGTKVLMTPAELLSVANKALAEGAVLQPGYAPFCKHLFLANPGPTKAGVARIDSSNEHMLRSGYEARRPQELPVLSRWFEGLEAPRAEFLDLILYSRRQLEEEGEDGTLPPEAEWGIVSINGELEEAETPMPPVTMMRNALGKAEGGSGVALDREAYAKSVAYWSAHATVR